MEIFIRVAVYCVNWVVVLVCYTVPTTKNRRIMGASFSTILDVFESDIRAIQSAESQTISSHDLDFGSIAETIV